MGNQVYDIVILGAGPAGLTAALYGSRAKLSTLVIEKAKAGGQTATTEEIENWPGTLRTTGPELTSKMKEHAEAFGAVFVRDEILDLSVQDSCKELQGKKADYYGKTVIVASGAEPRTLGIPGEIDFRGKGVSYCATCDADFFEELDVVVLGNGDTALEEAIYLTKFASSVTIVVIHEQGTVDATQVIAERAFANEKIRWIWNSTLAEIGGDELVDHVIIKNVNTGEQQELVTNGVFMFIGTTPSTGFLQGKVELAETGHIIADPLTLATSLPGLFAAGDCRQKALYQIVTAAADGATAATCCERYIHQEEAFMDKVINNPKPVAVILWNPTDTQSIDALIQVEAVLAAKYGDGIDLVKLDYLKNKQIADRYQVQSAPTLVFFNHGAHVGNVGLDSNPQQLPDKIQQLICMERRVG